MYFAYLPCDFLLLDRNIRNALTKMISRIQIFNNGNGTNKVAKSNLKDI